MTEKPNLFRKRIIPAENVPLKDDEILYIDDRIIVTRWKTLHPKTDFSHGASIYYLKEGYKVSKFLRTDESLLYWYCDILDYSYDKDSNSYTFRDLLADVIVYPDDFVKVNDLGEFKEAIENGDLTTEDVVSALKSLSDLLDIIYGGKFSKLTKELEGYL
ncbi:MAG: DUF402 domain-containing protein [Lachnospiraceae bacterium]|nr:DUF402 domain-containing protein [Lachnospiraceae bacterium]MDN4745093.1 DUF402 domain-containing protein [Lachnospiraceae bacterium C1.1]